MTEPLPTVTKTVSKASEEDDAFTGVHVPSTAELDAHDASFEAVPFKHGKKTYMKTPAGALYKMGETKGELGEFVGHWDEETNTIVHGDV